MVHVLSYILYSLCMFVDSLPHPCRYFVRLLFSLWATPCPILCRKEAALFQRTTIILWSCPVVRSTNSSPKSVSCPGQCYVTRVNHVTVPPECCFSRAEIVESLFTLSCSSCIKHYNKGDGHKIAIIWSIGLGLGFSFPKWYIRKIFVRTKTIVCNTFQNAWKAMKCKECWYASTSGSQQPRKHQTGTYLRMTGPLLHILRLPSLNLAILFQILGQSVCGP